jgi:hypothetical protein
MRRETRVHSQSLSGILDLHGFLWVRRCPVLARLVEDSSSRLGDLPPTTKIARGSVMVNESLVTTRVGD